MKRKKLSFTITFLPKRKKANRLLFFFTNLIFTPYYKALLISAWGLFRCIMIRAGPLERNEAKKKPVSLLGSDF